MVIFLFVHIFLCIFSSFSVAFCCCFILTKQYYKYIYINLSRMIYDWLAKYFLLFIILNFGWAIDISVGHDIWAQISYKNCFILYWTNSTCQYIYTIYYHSLFHFFFHFILMLYILGWYTHWNWYFNFYGAFYLATKMIRTKLNSEQQQQ